MDSVGNRAPDMCTTIIPNEMQREELRVIRNLLRDELHRFSADIGLDLTISNRPRTDRIEPTTRQTLRPIERGRNAKSRNRQSDPR